MLEFMCSWIYFGLESGIVWILFFYREALSDLKNVTLLHCSDDCLWVVCNYCSEMKVKPINMICFMNLKCRLNFKMEKYSLMYDSDYSLTVSFFKITEIDLKEAQRFFAQKFSCGASVTGEDEIIIQGDFTDDIIDVIQEKWPEVSIWNLCIYRSKLLKQLLLC